MSVAMNEYRNASSRNGIILPPLNLAGILTNFFKDAYLRMCYSVRQLMPCHVLGLTHSVNILEEDTVEIMMSAVAYPLIPKPRNVINFPRQKGLRLKHRGPVPFVGQGLALSSQSQSQSQQPQHYSMSPFFGQDGVAYGGGGPEGGYDNNGHQAAAFFPMTVQTATLSSSGLLGNQAGSGVGEADCFRSLSSMPYGTGGGGGGGGGGGSVMGMWHSHSPPRLSPDARGQPRSKSFDSSNSVGIGGGGSGGGGSGGSGGGGGLTLRTSPTFRSGSTKLERRDSMSSTRSSRRYVDPLGLSLPSITPYVSPHILEEFMVVW